MWEVGQSCCRGLSDGGRHAGPAARGGGGRRRERELVSTCRDGPQRKNGNRMSVPAGRRRRRARASRAGLLASAQLSGTVESGARATHAHEGHRAMTHSATAAAGRGLG